MYKNGKKYDKFYRNGKLYEKGFHNGKQILGPSGIQARYIRDITHSNNSYPGNHWVQMMAFDDSGNNVALNKTAYNTEGLVVTPSITDGHTTSDVYYDEGGVTSERFVIVDLAALYNLRKIQVWHYYVDGRTYHENKTQVSTDGVNWVTVFDSAVSGEYQETPEGHEILL